MTRLLRGSAVAVGAALLPAAANACAVCGADGGGGSRTAFFWTTVLLSLVPLALFAGGLWFLRRAAGDWMRDELAEPTDAVPATDTPRGHDASPAAGAARPRNAAPTPPTLATDAG